ncbi:MAG: hypothetical protein JSR78_05705 [Proteobacteria bacterium]|nr:hypothetical protein [Pseudomonadota bacterium]
MALWADPRSSKAKIRSPDRRLDEDAFEGTRDDGQSMPMMLLGAAFGVALLGVIIRLGYPGAVTTVADQALDQPALTSPSSATSPSAH